NRVQVNAVIDFDAQQVNKSQRRGVCTNQSQCQSIFRTVHANSGREACSWMRAGAEQPISIRRTGSFIVGEMTSGTDEEVDDESKRGVEDWLHRKLREKPANGDWRRAPIATPMAVMAVVGILLLLHEVTGVRW